MKKIIISSLMFLALASMFWGCYPAGPQTEDELDLVYTNHQKDHSFAGHNKYFISDSVVKITGDVGSGNPQYISQVYASQIVSRIKSNMASLGYTLVASSNLADYTIFTATSQSTTLVYYYDYYYYYYGYYYYYPYSITTSYTTGTLFMNFIDNNNIAADDSRPAVWVGLVNGLMEGSSTNIAGRINKSIDQAFSQSPYLHQ